MFCHQTLFIYLFIYLFSMSFSISLPFSYHLVDGLEQVSSPPRRAVVFFATQARHLSRMVDWQWAFLCPHQKLRNPCPLFPCSPPLLSSPSPPQDTGIDKFKMHFTVFIFALLPPNPFFPCISFNSYNCVYFCIYVAISRNLK